ncbi:MAG: 4Fe-4S dicluster domain-containing protein [Candidatus Aureabacteria bacterium]|nr:4Fe-4S dicluster domain-containing protein [Candidatus Auribacterota bacterium]
MQTYFITETGFLEFMDELARSSRVYFPRPLGEDYHLTVCESGKMPEIPFIRYRMAQSFKFLLFEPRLKVCDYFGEGEKEIMAGGGTRNIVVGAKACDLNGLAVLDFAFGGDVSDPFYMKNRQELLIISSDCTEYKDVCFCTLVGGKPHPERGYDLNLSPVKGGYVVHAGSARGGQIANRFKNYFSAPTRDQLAKLASDRKKMVSALEQHQREHGYLWGGATKELMERVYESHVWGEEAERCVECGACNFVCPTCHCFLLSEQGREKFSRLRNWDACQYKGFARVGGGSNPRPELYQRLRNRYEKKLHFGPTVMGVSGCTGCGRCVEACIGKIDMREVLKKLSGCK